MKLWLYFSDNLYMVLKLSITKLRHLFSILVRVGGQAVKQGRDDVAKQLLKNRDQVSNTLRSWWDALCR